MGSGEIGLGQHDDELLSAPARDRVALTRERGQEPADLAQHDVAVGVAEGVVDLLEAVEVEQHDRELMCEAVGAGDLGGECLLEGAPVREPGERVDARLTRLLLRPAERAEQRAGEDQSEEHQCRQRKKAGLDDPQVGGVLPVPFDPAGEIGADADLVRQRHRDSASVWRGPGVAAVDVRELHAVRSTRRQPPQRRGIGRHLRDDRSDCLAAADELHTRGEGVAETVPVRPAVELEQQVVLPREPLETLLVVAADCAL